LGNTAFLKINQTNHVSILPSDKQQELDIPVFRSGDDPNSELQGTSGISNYVTDKGRQVVVHQCHKYLDLKNHYNIKTHSPVIVCPDLVWKQHLLMRRDWEQCLMTLMFGE
jgi:hypothetical protein